MTQNFVSRSQHDKDIRMSFERDFREDWVKSICMEFEQMYPPAWQNIRNPVSSSDAVFCCLDQI